MSVKKIALTASMTAALFMGATFIPEHEGMRLNAYLDPVGIPTVCGGSTKGVKLGMKFTKEECKLMVQEDLLESMLILRGSVPSATFNKLDEFQILAFSSFIYNVGPGKYGVKDGFVELKKVKRPSSILAALQRGDIKQACKNLYNPDPVTGKASWTTAKGIPFKGLVKRRIAERGLCEKRYK